MNPPKQSLERYIQQLYRYRLRTRHEVITRCEQKGYAEQDVRAVVAKMENHGLIDDRRFTRMYLEEGLQLREKGPKRLFWELLQKGVDRHIIEDEWEEVRSSIDLFDIIRGYVRRHKAWDMQKIKASLVRKGFSYEWVDHVDAIYHEQDDGADDE